MPPPPSPAAAWLAAFGAEGPAAEAALRAVPFAPATLKEALDGALALGRAAGRLPEAMRILAEGEARLRRLRDRLGLTRRDRGEAALPAVAVIDRAAPLRLAGRWVPDLVAHAGGRAVLVRPGQPPREVTWDALAGSDPDVVVVALPEGSPAARETLEAGPAWASLRAVRDGRVLALDGDRLGPAPGPDVVAMAERLAEWLYPKRTAEPEARTRR